MVFIAPLESTILSIASAEPQVKDESSADFNKPNADSTNMKDSDVPVVKMVYKNKSYEMSPFVVMENEDLERLNFPKLPDDFEPIVKISPDDSISFSFLTKPREINAFLVDYDADTTEMTPLHRVGKEQFNFADGYGPNTLELRVIYPDGKYVTYTCLIEVEKRDVKEVDLETDNNNSMYGGILNSNGDNSYRSFQSNDPLSSGFGQVSPTEEHLLNQYDTLVDTSNEREITELDLLNSKQLPTNTCEYREIPIKDIQTDNNINNTGENIADSTPKPRWTALDLGQEQYICGIKVSFVNVDDEIKFFTLAFSNDGIKYTPAEYYSSTGTNSPSEIYDLKEGPIKARFIKISELDITESIAWISDLIVLGNTQL